jgi:nucleoid DNA-binding protein
MKKASNQFTKSPMVRELSRLADIPQAQASFIYDIFFDVYVKQIKAGKDIVMPNIGTLRLIPGREMRSNLTGVQVPPHKRLHFTVNVALARLIRVKTREFPIKN